MTHSEPRFTRREAGSLIAASGATLLVSGVARAQDEPSKPAPPPPAFAGDHQPVPLSFDPKKLVGLSERLLVSHHQNNYGGAVRNLNRVEQELAGMSQDTPGFLVFGLMERALLFRGSKLLHELYFANLGGDGAVEGAVRDLLSRHYGTFGRFEALFHATAMSLAGGSGWAVLALELATGAPVVYAAADHTRSLPQAAPLLVLDMYEHAYHLDFGAAAARYVEAFFRNLAWEEVDRRLTRARAASAAIRGA